MLKNKYGELRGGWMLALSQAVLLIPQTIISLIVGLLAVAQVGTATLLTNPNALVEASVALLNSTALTAILYTLMIGSMLLLFWLVYKRPLRQMGFYSTGWIKQLLFGSLFGIVLIVLSLVLLLLSGTAQIASVDWRGLGNALFWGGLVNFIFVGFFEEILSRGIMMTALKSTRSKWVIVLIPSILFGLMHIFNQNVTVFSLLNIMVVGILFAYLFIKTGRLWAPIGFHITWNFFQGYVFGIPVSGGAPSVSVMNVIFTGSDWLTGGAFGIEGGAACTIAIILGLVFVHFCLKQTNDFWRIDSDLPLTRGAAIPTEAVEDSAFSPVE